MGVCLVCRWQTLPVGQRRRKTYLFNLIADGLTRKDFNSRQREAVTSYIGIRASKAAILAVGCRIIPVELFPTLIEVCRAIDIGFPLQLIGVEVSDLRNR